MKVQTTFDGTRTDSGLRGEIRNISSDNFTPEFLTYGVLEGMIRELYDMFVQIEKGTEIKIVQMIGSGNGLRKNKVLCEIAEKNVRDETDFIRVQRRGRNWCSNQRLLIIILSKQFDDSCICSNI